MMRKHCFYLTSLYYIGNLLTFGILAIGILNFMDKEYVWVLVQAVCFGANIYNLEKIKQSRISCQAQLKQMEQYYYWALTEKEATKESKLPDEDKNDRLHELNRLIGLLENDL